MKMKKYIVIALTLLMIGCLTGGCKKDRSPNGASASIKDKTWWGQFYYAGKSVEYYAVHFNGNGTLTWSEFAGDYQGKWAVDGDYLAITFDGTGHQFKSTISGDNKLLNIINIPSNNFFVIGGELITNSNTSLDNTIWTGTASSAVTTAAMQMSFLAGFKVDLKFGSLLPISYPYTLFAQNKVIRIDTGFFGIVTSATEMKGSVDKAGYLWYATKQ
jgi:hypothetical protein